MAQFRRSPCVTFATALLVAAALAACGGGGSSRAPLQADAPAAGATPFIETVRLHDIRVDDVSSVKFTIAPAPGSASRAVSVQYSASYLVANGRAATGGTSIVVPVFGLYAGASNAVTLSVTYTDGAVAELPVTVQAAAWTDPNGILDHPTAVTQRAPGSALGFDFFYLKSLLAPVVILDSDGRVRWVGPPGVEPSMSADFFGGVFLLGAGDSTQITQVRLDGTLGAPASLQDNQALRFHHDIEDGKIGVLDNVDVNINGVIYVGSFLQEIVSDGTLVDGWDMARILSDYMEANGDDPTLFVRPDVDWFHMNTAIYDPRDDSVIVSSRENFVIKIDYATGQIKWILGDPTKYWYTFPSLRAKALAFVGDVLVPVGQHSLTIAPDGDLMLFNNGSGSLHQPAGAPRGEERGYSAVSSYKIDETARTVTNSWNFDYGTSVLAGFCSSARALPDGSVLVDYATAELDTAVRLVGLDPSHQVVFDYRFANTGCTTAWNAQPIALEAMRFD
jgi:arylsulfate sulfotransferase